MLLVAEFEIFYISQFSLNLVSQDFIPVFVIGKKMLLYYCGRDQFFLQALSN